MSKTIKNILSSVIAIVMLLGVMVFASACGGEAKTSYRVMNLSINPSIEFVIENNKIVTVSANNDEGNYIIGKVSFVGMTIEKAVNKYLETLKNDGFIIEGDNNIKIEVAGDSAEKLINQTKNYVNNFFDDFANINITINTDELDRDYLEGLLSECMQEYNSNDLNNMSVEKLIKEIKSSRKETKDIYSQEMKEFYYNFRAHEIIKAKYQSIAQQLTSILESNGIEVILNEDQLHDLETYFSTYIDDYNRYLTTYTNRFKEHYLDGSLYQEALDDYIEAEQALLEARIDDTVTDYTAYEQAVNEAKFAIDSVRESIDAVFDELVGYMNDIEWYMQTNITSINDKFNNKEIQKSINNVIDDFNKEFKTNYSEHIGNNLWTGISPEVSE